MVTSDFRQEMELWPFSAWALKNAQYNRLTVIYGRIGEIFASYRKLWLRSTMMMSYFTLDLAIGQIPRSIERIS